MDIYLWQERHPLDSKGGTGLGLAIAKEIRSRRQLFVRSQQAWVNNLNSILGVRHGNQWQRTCFALVTRSTRDDVPDGTRGSLIDRSMPSLLYHLSMFKTQSGSRLSARCQSECSRLDTAP